MSEMRGMTNEEREAHSRLIAKRSTVVKKIYYTGLFDKQVLIREIKLFRDKAWCHHSHYRAAQLWSKLAKHVDAPYKQRIATEWSHVQIGHGFEQACFALDTEVKLFIEYLEGLI